MNVAFISGVPGWMEVLVVILVIVLLFGAKRLPDLARSMGRSISEFKKGRAEGLASEGLEEDDQSNKPGASSS